MNLEPCHQSTTASLPLNRMPLTWTELRMLRVRRSITSVTALQSRHTPGPPLVQEQTACRAPSSHHSNKRELTTIPPPVPEGDTGSVVIGAPSCTFPGHGLNPYRRIILHIGVLAQLFLSRKPGFAAECEPRASYQTSLSQLNTREF